VSEPAIERVGSLELDQDLPFQRRFVAVQRAGWVLVALVLVAGLLGVFGTGPLAHATATAPSKAFSVDYDRFLRTAQITQLHISIEASGDRTTRIALSHDYLNAVNLGGVSPQPDSQTSRGNRTFLTYDGGAPSEVDISVAPRLIGVHAATVWVGDRHVSFHQVIYP
jgi:hypothetical protein